MMRPIKNIGLFLVAVILIPIFFFIAREIYSLSENEAVLERIYRNQIESLLFSVNQYSEDLVRSWGMKLELEKFEGIKNNKKLAERTKNLFLSNPSIKSIFFADVSRENIRYDFNDGKVESRLNDGAVQFILKLNAPLLDRLLVYKKNNFTKFEPIESKQPFKIQILVFMISESQFCGFAIDKQKFVRENLSSKIQSITAKEFIVSVYDSSSGNTIYSTSNTIQKDFVQSRKLWLIPNYSLGINMEGKSLDGILKNRTYSGIILISVLSLMVLLAARYGYMNIKNELELAQIKNEFVSNVSHELRTPLALINMFAETLYLGRVKTEEKRNEYYGIIQQETERLSKIVNTILNFSKIEAGKWKYNFTMADINTLVEKVFLNYKFHLENKGFLFSLETQDGLPDCYMDSEAISEALINLIDNAVKYSDQNKKVILRTGSIFDSVFIEIEDKGIGISTEDQKRIFDKFYRAQSGNVHNTKGTGLGLTLVKHIVDAHRGKIVLTSSINSGSTFRIILPIKKA